MVHNEIGTTSLVLDVAPLDALVDEPLTIRLTGAQPSQQVKFWAHAHDVEGHAWVSWALFMVDTEGVIDLTTQAPVAGDYQRADPMGLFWSMKPLERKPPVPFMSIGLTAIEIELIVEIEGQAVAAARVKRRFASEDVVCTPVSEAGLVGTFAYPAHSGPVPAVLLLSGSDGQLRVNQAALLASRGIAALSLVYFGEPGLPQLLTQIPLEYFQKALHWLQQQSVVQGDKLGVIGLSRGGELALLLGATFPEIKTVVAGSPSGLVHAGLERSRFAHSAWTYRGQPLQQVMIKFTPALSFKLMWQAFRVRSFPMRDMFLTTLKDQQHLAAATIPVEKTQGPILLISGDDDQLWPATIFSELVMQRLASQGHAYPDQHLHYPGAGHFVCFPYGYPFLPPTVKRVQGLAVGGTVEATAEAIADSWPKILAFLKQHLTR